MSGSHASDTTKKHAPPPLLPSWCSGFRKESLTSERAYEERIMTSMVTSEIRLRQESVRYWNRRLEEVSADAFAKLVAPTCLQISSVLNQQQFEDENENETESDHNRTEDRGDNANNNGIEGNKNDETSATIYGDEGNNWEYCQQLFGLSTSAATSTTTPKARTDTSTSETQTKSEALSTTMTRLLLRYPLELLPVFVITSPLISNCLRDRTKICHSMWRQLNNLNESTSNVDVDVNDIDIDIDDDGTICLYLPRLLSSWTETLQLIWDGLLYHFENTHEAPTMDAEDSAYYANPNDLFSKRHSYFVSKRMHYERIVDRKITTESQKSKIGTKKQQSLQDFILEFLKYVYEEPEELLREQRERDRHGQQKRDSTSTTKNSSKRPRRRRRRRCGNLILLLEDPRIVHQKGGGISTSTSASGGRPNSNIVQSQLLETIAAWRGLHGIPVSLVVFNSIGSQQEVQQNNVLLNPSFESNAMGRFGIRTIRCSIPSLLNSSQTSLSTTVELPPSMAFAVWCQYFLEGMKETPIPLLAPCFNDSSRSRNNFGGGNTTMHATELVLRMCKDALQNESSCSGWIQSVRSRIISNFYSQKGSFVWDALNPQTAKMMKSFENNRSHSNSTIDNNDTGNKDKDSQPFTIGNNDVNIFQPEFVAWFCSYQKAHNLLSSTAGEQKANMTLSDKCDGLLKCYGLLLPSSKKSSKRRRLSKSASPSTPESKEISRDSGGGGRLQFWWNISCSLLPLHVLSLTTTNEEMITTTTTSTTSTRGSTSNRNDMSGQYRWILERLADVYRQLMVVVEVEEIDENKELTSTATTGVGEKGNSAVALVESGTPAAADADAAVTNNTDVITQDVVTENSVDKVASNEEEIYGKDDGGDDDEIEQDFVESTFRRYLKRGTDKGNFSSSRSTEDGNGAVAGGEKEIIKINQRRRRELATMVRQLVVLIEALRKINSSIAVNDEDDHVATKSRSDKIRLGMTEIILEMNRLALGRVEKWTGRWIDSNPLMAAVEEDEIHDYEEHNADSYDNANKDGRPINFRRQILDNLPYGSRQLYEVLEGRLSVERDDWYHSFGGTVEDFAVGVWTLRKCGLIRPKKTIIIAATNKQQRVNKRRQEVVSYEKVAVVWC